MLKTSKVTYRGPKQNWTLGRGCFRLKGVLTGKYQERLHGKISLADATEYRGRNKLKDDSPKARVADCLSVSCINKFPIEPGH